MLPLSIDLKLKIEFIELVIIVIYLLAGIAKPKQLTYLLFVCMGGCLAYDILVLHGNHSLPMWGALNTPLLIWGGYLIYEKILKKAAPRVAQRLAALCTMLFRG